MPYKVVGTNFEAEDIGTWLRFELAVERHELALHKERCLPETAQKIREEAMLAVIAEGLFRVERVEEESKPEKMT